MSRKKAQGATLAEVLLTMFILFLVLGVAAALVNNYSRVLRQTAARDRSITAAEVGLDRLRGELGEAVEIELPPGTSGSSTTLRFLKLDPGRLEARLPRRLPDPLPGSFDPEAAADLVRVEYFLSGGGLVRSVPSTGAVERIAEGLQGFTVSHGPSGSLEVSLTFLEDGRTRTFTTVVYRWTQP